MSNNVKETLKQTLNSGEEWLQVTQRAAHILALRSTILQKILDQSTLTVQISSTIY